MDGFVVWEEDVSEADAIRDLAMRLFPEAVPGPTLCDRDGAELAAGSYARTCLVTDEAEGVVDVIRATKHGWELVTIESGTSVKGAYVSRMAFLAELAGRVGLDVRCATVVTLDKTFRRDPELDVFGLFAVHDVSGSVLRHREAVRNALIGMLDTWKHPHTVSTAYRCRRPDTCEACSELMPDRTVHSIFSLHRGGETARSLYHEGIESILDIPPDTSLSKFQTIQIDAVRRNSMHVDSDALSRFLKRLRYPLRFLDFEAVMYAVPRYTDTRPWQHIAFQYSLHSMERPDGPLEHRSFIAEPATDPRPPLVEALHRDLGDEGTIVVYGRTFESGVLKRLGGYFEDHQEWARTAVGRVVDLSEPFQTFSVYHPDQVGRVSMKRVLPALTGVGYAGHEIGDGRSAAVIYQALCRRVEDGEPVDPRTLGAVFGHLREYCALDTYGMFLIYRTLHDLAADGSAESGRAG